MFLCESGSGAALQEVVAKFLAQARISCGDADLAVMLRSPFHRMAEYRLFFEAASRSLASGSGRERDAVMVRVAAVFYWSRRLFIPCVLRACSKRWARTPPSVLK